MTYRFAPYTGESKSYSDKGLYEVFATGIVVNKVSLRTDQDDLQTTRIKGSLTLRSLMVKKDPPKLVPPGTNFSINKEPSGTYFTAKYGLPLKNLDYLPQMKERRPSMYFTCKTWTSGISRRFPRFLETTQARQFSSMQCTVVSFPATCNCQFPHTLCKSASNVRFERCMEPLRHTHEKQSFIFLAMQL